MCVHRSVPPANGNNNKNDDDEQQAARKNPRKKFLYTRACSSAYKQIKAARLRWVCKGCGTLPIRKIAKISWQFSIGNKIASIHTPENMKINQQPPQYVRQEKLLSKIYSCTRIYRNEKFFYGIHGSMDAGHTAQSRRVLPFAASVRMRNAIYF